jgi:hypothetical protein
MSEPLNTAEVELANERPFPWYCPKCRRKEVRRESVNYQCQRMHEGQPVTVVIADLKVPRCSACGELVFDYFAEEQINAAKRRQFSSTTPNGSIPLPSDLAGTAKAGADKVSTDGES